MKTAVSIPDDLFQEAEKLARRLGVGRSALYAQALSQLVASERRSWVTEALNEVYANEDSRLDPVLAEMQARSLPRDW